MPPVIIEGFILSRVNFRETSVILTIYSFEFGKIKGVLKGVRKEKTKIPPLAFSEGAHINISVYKKKGDLNLFSTPNLIEFVEFENNLYLQKIYFYILKLIDLFVPENQKEEKIFFLLKNVIDNLKKTEKPWLIFVGFKIKFIEILGYGIKIDKCCKCDKKTSVFFLSPKHGGILCRKCGYDEINCVKISKKIVSIIRFIKKIPLENIEVLKVEKKICEEINFYCNFVLYYHTNLEFIWWKNEKDIFRTNNRRNI